MLSNKLVMTAIMTFLPVKIKLLHNAIDLQRLLLEGEPPAVRNLR